MIFICGLKTLHFAVLFFIPLNEFGRILNYDLMLFYGVQQNVNLTHFLLALYGCYFWYRMYFGTKIRAVVIVQKVIYENYADIFPHDRMLFRNNFVPTNLVVIKFTNIYLFMVNYFSPVLGMYVSSVIYPSFRKSQRTV